MDSCFFILTFSHFFFPLAPRRLCLRSCGTFLNTSCSLSLHNWNSAFKFKWLITHSDSYRKVCNRYQSLYTWQPRWEEILYQLREVQSGRAVYLRKFSFQGQEVDKSVGGAWVMREECLYQTSGQEQFKEMCTQLWLACGMRASDQVSHARNTAPSAVMLSWWEGQEVKPLGAG